MPDVVLYLQASPDALWARVNARARPAEAGMTRAYLDAVCASYEAFFTNPPFGMRVVVVEWETFGTAEFAWKAVEAAFSRGFR